MILSFLLFLPYQSSSRTTCQQLCQLSGYTTGTCRLLFCNPGEIDIGQDNCFRGFVCCCSGTTTSTSTSSTTSTSTTTTSTTTTLPTGPTHLPTGPTQLGGNETSFVSSLPIVNFTAWLGANDLILNVGQKAEVKIYVLNNGTSVDSYTIEKTGGDLQTTSPENLKEVYPQDVKSTSILVWTTKVGTSNAQFRVCSEEEPSICKVLSLTANSYMLKSLPEIDSLLLIVLIVSSIIIFKVVE
ncbi:MAG TPA: hypothetical protein ENG34_00555 [Candidatus Aenigmarchaeota archaeon]|nr:hypothetical protein [Candidatus Aenigmarchaeota archaeon]